MSAVKRLFKIQEMNWVGNFVLCVSAAIFFSACQKTPSPETNASAVESTNVASGVVSSSPTGLVKNATRHTEETANVTRWWDINEKNQSGMLMKIASSSVQSWEISHLEKRRSLRFVIPNRKGGSVAPFRKKAKEDL